MSEITLQLITPATVEPITTEEAKTHARIATSLDDNYVGDLISAARQKFEKDTASYVAEAEYELVIPLDKVTTEIVLPLRPVIEVETINDLEEATDYTVAIDSQTGIATITLVNSATEDLTIDFKVGFADPEMVGSPEEEGPSNVPKLIQHAIKALVAHWYNSREAFSEGDMKSVPGTYHSIVTNTRIA